ncbi:MAG TPA: hypothetical protein VHK86_03125 [Nitrososphaera sp.]|jgi:hypothetical protein|nr:hypothetical protein [Nitrososphaera sp.]
MNESSILAMWTQEEMYDRIVKLIENAKTEVLAFLNAYTLTISTDNEKFQTPKREARRRGVKFRYITEVTKDNLSYCKRQLNMVDELRHLNNLRGNFLISESESVSSLEVSPQHPITEGYYTDNKKLVEMMRYVFETLWDNAIPAEERINQLEAGIYYSPSESSSAIAKEEKKKIIDRFYICSKCNSAFIFVDDMEEHQASTGHEGVKEFPFFEK